MNSLVLRTRLEMLCSNLERVQFVLDTTKKRGCEIDRLKANLSGARKDMKPAEQPLKWTAGHLSALSEYFDNPGQATDTADIQQPKTAVDRLQVDIETIRKAFEQVKERLEHCSADLSTLVEYRVEIADTRQRTLQEKVVNQAIVRVVGLKGVLGRLDAPNGPEALTEAWKEYEVGRDQQSQPLFAEYVDLLRGLALRESGFEEGISMLADRLLDDCDRVAEFRWESLAIPAHGPSASDKARMIRLGFPEWTLWALPFAAFELGRVVVREQGQLRRYVDDEVRDHSGKEGWSRRLLEAALADAFAVHTTGPAYACAALLIRLDPSPSESMEGNVSADGERAEVVLAMLKKAHEEDKDAPFAFIEKLEEAWDEAVRQTGARPLNDREVDRCTRWVQNFWDWAHTHTATAKYLAQSLVHAAKWAKMLLDQPEAVQAAGDDVRDVLNTAWLCRLDNPTETRTIHVAAKEMWGRMRKSSAAPGTTGAAPLQSVPPTRE